ncbi:MAG: hypothetical protein HWN79_19230 [Candidatus Lokiarchaeota archaeon]|nr:hypothetical protein [Candidatus Lokiarchaeota archaeon]
MCVVGSCQAIFDGNDSKSPTVPIEQQSVEQVDTREVSSYDDEEDYVNDMDSGKEIATVDIRG